MYPIKDCRRSNSSFDNLSNSSGDLMWTTSIACCNCDKKWDLVALFECISKQKGSNPIFAKRFCTTDNAAIFSATNNTRFPLYKALAIMFVMVCDFPVPGGPWRMKLFPCPDSMTDSICDESTSNGMAKLAGSTSLSICRASTSLSSSFHWTRPSIRLLITGFSFSLSAFVWISFHITNLLNEKMPNMASSKTSHPFISRTLFLTIARICFTSTPLSSFGNGFKPERFNPNSCFNSSTNVVFKIVSSSRMRIT